MIHTAPYVEQSGTHLPAFLKFITHNATAERELTSV